MRIPLLSALLLIPVSLAQAADFKQKNTKANLKAFAQRMHTDIWKNDDKKAASAAFMSMVGDEKRIKAAFKDDLKPKTLKSILGLYKRLGEVPPALIPKVINKERSTVQVHAATTEEILKNDKNSIVFKEFPGGAVSVAKLLKPKTTFYEVEFVKAGESRGMKFHLIFWDGKQWTMLGPIWRAILQP